MSLLLTTHLSPIMYPIQLLPNCFNFIFGMYLDMVKLKIKTI